MTTDEKFNERMDKLRQLGQEMNPEDNVHFHSPSLHSSKPLVSRSATVYAVTGTFHGSLVEAHSEGEARRIFHRYYKGESITHVIKRGYAALLA